MTAKPGAGSRQRVPLFPLRTVLYPGGPLPLRIFETRYLDMISRCIRDDTPFGVVLIREGSETGPAKTVDVGTLARVSDWYQGSDGLLGVTALGERRFRLLSSEIQQDKLTVGDIELLDRDAEVPLPDDCQGMAQVLAGVLGNLGKLYETLDKHYEDAGWVSFRFAEILPLAAADKQQYLELQDPIERLRKLKTVLKKMGSEDRK